MSTQEKFTAAINVIRSLPKNGSYQPSKELLLRFYAYFKQGTIGRNNQPKPSFWDVVNRAKWQAWENLGDMSKEDAMQEYVNELKKIVETMAYTNPVADFVSSLDSFYESVSIDDLEMVVGPIDRGNSIEKADSSSIVSIHPSVADTDIDEECFHDVMESTGDLKKANIQKVNQYLTFNENVDNLESNNSVDDLISNNHVDDLVLNNHIPISEQNGYGMVQVEYSNEVLNDFKLQIMNTVSTMKHDLDLITNRVARIEIKLNEMKTRTQPRRASHRNLYQMIFLIGWPIVVQLIFIWFQRRNRQKSLPI